MWDSRCESNPVPGWITGVQIRACLVRIERSIYVEIWLDTCVDDHKTLIPYPAPGIINLNEFLRDHIELRRKIRVGQYSGKIMTSNLLSSHMVLITIHLF